MFRDTWMEVNLDQIRDNVREIKAICGKKVIAVLKANAYGSGDIYAARAVLDGGADMIAVSSLDEAVIFRNEGYDGELLILGASDADAIETMVKERITVNAFSMDFVKAVVKQNCNGLKVHLKVDSGMNRIGFKDKDELKQALHLLLAAGCQVEGIFTHFCCADTDREMTDRQFAVFREAVEYLDYPFSWIHCDNSDATIFFRDTLSNACRVGISLYGISTYKDDLRSPLSLFSKVSMVKTVKKGETIGYGATYETTSDEIIATLPIGYADGFIRANQGRHVYVNGEYAEVVGRVCMDQCMVRLEKPVPVGTVAEVFGPHISLEKMAQELHTIPYEIICLISPRVTRKYLMNGKVFEEENTRMLLSEISSGKDILETE